MDNILITGGAGFIGSNLAESLLKTGKYKIYILDIKENAKNLENIAKQTVYIQGDIRDKELLNRLFKNIEFHGVIHLAAVSRVIWGEKNPELCISTNVIGTENLLQSLTLSKSWLIFGSSREVYGEPQILPVKEDAPKIPINLYGKTKLKGEKLVEQYSRKYKISSIILRFSNVYGNEKDIMDRVIPKFILNGIKGLPLEIQGGNQVLDFTYIDDTVEGIMKAIAYLERNRYVFDDFHILTGKPTKITDLPLLISRHIGRKVKVTYTDPRKYDVEKFYGDPEKAKHILKFEARIDISEGIKLTTKRFKEVLE